MNVQQDWQTCCAPEAGTGIAFARRVRKPNEILGEIETQSPKSDGVSQKTFYGTYNMVHDGWKGTLKLYPPESEYIAADGHVYPVLTRFKGHGIIFFIVGLGGENAEGTGGQKFEGFLMTQTRDAIAGFTWWNRTPFGFYAIRK